MIAPGCMVPALIIAFCLFPGGVGAEQEGKNVKLGPRELLRNQVANTRSLLDAMLERTDLDKKDILPLYHETTQLQTRPDADVVGRIEEKLWAIGGPGIVKVRLTDAAADLDGAVPLDLVLVSDKPRPIFVIVKNETDVHAHISLRASEGAGLRVEDKTRIVWAGRTMGFRYDLMPTGALQGDVELAVAISQRPEGKPPRDVAVPVRVKADLRELGTLKGSLVDEETGEPVYARVYLNGSDGAARAPEGAFARSTMTGDEYFYGEQRFEARLPAGRTTIEVLRGPEYRPLRQEIEIKAGETTEATLKLERLANMASKGWFSGDVHIHANYTKDEFVTPEQVLTQALGEDLNLVNMNVANSTGAWIHDRKYFEGKPNRLSRGNHIICWNEEFRNYNLYGHMCMIGLERLVEPIYTGFPDTPHWADFPPNYDLAKNAQEQKGAVSYPHPVYYPGQFGFRWASAKEFPADLALGVIDAIDVLSNADDQESMKLWYGVLNSGLRCAISAGSDAFTNVKRHWIPGADRVYVHVGQKFGYEEWIRNYKQGRSFATNGPLLFFTVNDQEPGAELRFNSGEKPRLKAQLKVTSILPIHVLEIVVNGEVVASSNPQPGEETVELTADVELQRSSWIAGRCMGPPHRFNTMNDLVLAHSSPVYCVIGDRKIGSEKDSQFFVEWVDSLWENTGENGKFESLQQREHVRRVFMRAKKIYEDMKKDASSERLDL